MTVFQTTYLQISKPTTAGALKIYSLNVNFINNPFFPRTVRDWNGLPDSCACSDSAGLFGQPYSSRTKFSCPLPPAAYMPDPALRHKLCRSRPRELHPFVTTSAIYGNFLHFFADYNLRGNFTRNASNYQNLASRTNCCIYFFTHQYGAQLEL